MNGLPPGFVSARRSFRDNLSRPRLRELLDAKAIRWARGIDRFAYLPAMLEDVYGAGYEHFPLSEAPAPIVCLSHKKIQDIIVTIPFMGGRPLDRFHDVTLVAQGGLFCGIFAYRDLVPVALKRPPFIRTMAFLSRAAGRWTERLVRSFHAHPVFREGVDLPSEEDYTDRRFAGPLVMGVDYPTFLRQANRSTMASVVAVQREMEEKNRSFVIFPEGKYWHDGAISDMQDLAGIVAFRKQKGIVPVSITYDELCRDRWGRFAAWAVATPMMPPPQDKKDIPAFLAALHHRLQQSSVVTASHLIAAILQSVRARGEDWIEERYLRDRFALCVDACAEACAQAQPEANAQPGALCLMDERLKSRDFQEERLHRFLTRKGAQWLKPVGPGFRLDEKALSVFAKEERTVDDIAWNANNIRHIRLPL